MADTTGTLARPGVGGLARGLALSFAVAFQRHRHLHLMAAMGLATGVVVGAMTHNLPDFGVLQDYGFYLLSAFWIGGCGFAIFRVVWLAAVERDPSPLGAFFASFRNFFGNRERIANSVNGLAVAITFISGFSVLKGAIAILSPFAWDRPLAALERWLHFGHHPYEYLLWLFDFPGAIFAINVAYNLWFVVLIATLFTAAITNRDTVLRHRFLMSFMLLWLLAGFLLAMGFSSAGPCYFGRLGFGDDFEPLMQALAETNAQYPIWALSTQDMLWEGYTGIAAGSIGISAFPSMHVANAVLFALYAGRRSAVAGAVLWAFAAVILVGSVVLGWHYAVDGYAGGLLALLIWRLVGRVKFLYPATLSHGA